MKKISVMFFALVAAMSMSAETIKVDTLTADKFGYDKLKNGYVDSTYTSTVTGAIYKTNANGGVKFLQFRSKYSKSGIVSTTSGGYIKSVQIIQKDTLEGAKNIDLYADTTAYSAPSDLYGTKANKIGFVNKLDTTIFFKENYIYFGLRSNNGARYVDTIIVTWTDTKPGKDPETWVPDTIQVSDIKALADAGDIHSHYIVGIVDGDPWINFSTGCMWLRDINNPTDSVEGFKIDDASKKAFTEETLAATIGAGDTIMIFANGVAYYTDKTSGSTYLETTSGFYVETLGKDQSRKEATFVAGTAEYDEEESVLSFSFADADSMYLMIFESADHENPNSIAGVYKVEDFQKVTLGNEVISEGTLTIDFVDVDAQGNMMYNVKFASNAYKLTGDTLTLGAFKQDNNNITCARAAEIAASLADNTTTTNTYNIYGYYAKFTGKYSWTASYPTQTFWMTDTKGSSSGVFMCYQAGIAGATSAADTIVKDDFVCVTAKIKRYGSTFETEKPGTIRKLDPKDAPVLTDIEVTEVTVAEAIEVGYGLDSVAGSETTTTGTYAVTGYVVKIKDADAYSYYMSDDPTATDGDFQAFKCSSVDADVNVGDKVRLVGIITRYEGTGEGGAFTNIEIKNGTLTHVMTDGFWNMEAGVKAVKTLRNGQILIERNGVIYTVMGTAAE